MSYELSMKNWEDKDDEKKKIIAFRSSTNEEKSNKDRENDELFLLTRNFKRTMKTKKLSKKKFTLKVIQVRMVLSYAFNAKKKRSYKSRLSSS